jgi:hypothetical protein
VIDFGTLDETPTEAKVEETKVEETTNDLDMDLNF